jgi:hypothetical protein
LLDVIPACAPPGAGKPPAISGVLGDIADSLSALSDELCGTYLSHAIMPRAMAGATPGEGGA